ncbi:MAG: thrombospondin type 3 repeat-containing protein [Lachnospiraceae bacterium]|nr:thrombospondin type 3 repeat-containing protein [Lachnospiraceae bacterium]
MLRFWRGNNNTLWNYSIEISYEQYLNNQNCIVVKDWDNSGHCTYYFNAKICLDSMLQIGFIDMELYSNMLDVDGDGLLLEEEYKYGTLPSEKDTDGDGLSDYNEIYLYGTNPTNIDSDNDGISDGTEIDMGLNPLNFDTDNNGIADGNEILRQTIKNVSFDKMKDNEIVPEISIIGKGDYSLKVDVEDISKNKMFVDMDFIVGNVYDFRHDEDLEFEKCELIFNINKVITNYDELAVAYYNEETNQIEIL